ncbi:hypothetical protein PFISCL1PPCAC_25419, partial [Pristionchus fissidentatus]
RCPDPPQHAQPTSRMAFVSIGSRFGTGLFALPADLAPYYNCTLLPRDHNRTGCYKHLIGKDRDDIILKKTDLNGREVLDKLAELRILKDARHANIARPSRVYTTDTDVASLRFVYTIMPDYGPTLRSVISSGEELSLLQIKCIIRQTLSAISYLNSRAVVHGDINPSCIFYDGQKATLFGFGCAANGGSLINERGPNHYRAIEILEQWTGTYDRSVDIWSVPAMLLELLGSTHFAHWGNHALDIHMQVCGPINDHCLNQIGGDAYRHTVRLQSATAHRLNIVEDLAANGHSWLRQDIMAEPHLDSFIDNTLVIDPMLRLSAEDALAHPFLDAAHEAADATAATIDLSAPQLPENEDHARLLFWQLIH